MTTPYMIIVDDDEEMARIVQFCGEGLGFEVHWCRSGKLFKQVIGTRIPDVVVMDLVMPEIEGTELLQWMVKDGVSLPVILMSGYNEYYIKAAKIIGTEGGLSILGTLKKPFSLDDLETLLRPLVEDQVPPLQNTTR